MARIRRADKLALAILLLSAGAGAFAQTATQTPSGGLDSPVNATAAGSLEIPDLSHEKVFDGIHLPEYSRFWEKWHLVTVRFRKDNGEQRFIYANDLAYDALKKGQLPYPDGAMFGKVAFAVGDDPAFPNSQEPVGFRRLQIMKKDSKAYPRTQGWGYAAAMAFQGVPYAQEKTTVVACQACHQLVPTRDFVFSKASFVSSSASAVPFSEGEAMKSRFQDVQVSTLSPFSLKALSLVNVSAGKVHYLSMPLFTGSLEESIGPVTRYSSEAHEPYLLVDEEHAYFLAANPMDSTTDCQKRIRLALLKRNYKARKAGGTGKAAGYVQTGFSCDGVTRWEGKGASFELPRGSN